MRRIQREQPAAVLQHEARALRNQAGSETGEDALNERHHVAVTIDDTQIRGVATFGRKFARDYARVGARAGSIARTRLSAYAFDSIASTGTS